MIVQITKLHGPYPQSGVHAGVATMELLHSQEAVQLYNNIGAQHSR